MLHSGKYIKEEKGKYTQYKIIQRWYLTPSKLKRIGIMQNDMCWKCHLASGTFMHAIWECRVYPFWKTVLDHIGTLIRMNLPKPPRLWQSVIPGINKCKYIVVKVGVIAAARVILSFWKNSSPPEFKKKKDNMLKTIAY